MGVDLTFLRKSLPLRAMLDQNTPLEPEDKTLTFAPRDVAGAGTCALSVSNTSLRNSRPLGWVFVGAHSMPHSEHLIPFLN